LGKPETMKIGLITTLDTNIGDDFIREGICHVLVEIFKGEMIEFVSVNKHKPYTVYPTWHPVRLRDFAKRLTVDKNLMKNAVENLFPKIGFSRFDGCDLIVQCGAPVFWPNCSQNEWAKPIWFDVVGRLSNKIPVLNLAAGACYPWNRCAGMLLDQEDENYIKEILNYCRLTTVRDHLARDICASLGEHTPLIPCSAFLATRGRKAELRNSAYILINYMSGGGHYEWEQGIDAEQWKKTITELIDRLKQRHRIAFLCHDEKEYVLAKETFPAVPAFFPKNLKDYFDCVSEAKFGICNRMHASIGMAGLGIPSIAICTDTRMLMVSEIGLTIHCVGDIDAARLEDETERSLNQLGSEHERLLELKAGTWVKYLYAIREALSLA
jgi:hypothetical protein